MLQLCCTIVQIVSSGRSGLNIKWRDTRPEHFAAPPGIQPIACTTDPLIGSDDFTKWAVGRCRAAGVSDGTTAAEARHDRLVRAVSMMVSAPFSPHRIIDLAATAGMSRSSFSECFAGVFGLPPMNFLKRERLRVAADLLFTSSLSVKAVAGRTGYESASYFSRAFQDAFGITPSDVSRQGAANRSAASAAGKLIALANMTSDDAVERLSREHLQLICDATLDVLWDIDLRTGLVWWGEGMSRVFGYATNQIGPDTAWCQDHIHPEDRTRVVAGMKAACDNDDLLWRDEFRYLKADKTYANVLDRGVVIRDTTGRAIRFVGAMNELPSRRGIVGSLTESPEDDDANGDAI